MPPPSVEPPILKSGDRKLVKRMRFDAWMRRVVSLGGISVIVAVCAIFVYLGGVVLPLFADAEIEQQTHYTLPLPTPVQPSTGNADWLTHPPAYIIDEQREMAVRVTAAGEFTFFHYATGDFISANTLSLPPGVVITSFAQSEVASQAFAFGLSNGQAIVAKVQFQEKFVDGTRSIVPVLIFPLSPTSSEIEDSTHQVLQGEIVADDEGYAIQKIALSVAEASVSIAALTAQKKLLLVSTAIETNNITGEIQHTVERSVIPQTPENIDEFLIESNQTELWLLSGARQLMRFDIRNKANPQHLESTDLVDESAQVSAMTFLSGGHSLIVGTKQGKLAQWFLVREQGNTFKLKKIRSFPPMPQAILRITPEYARKGFIVGDQAGNLASYFATSKRLLLREKMSETALTALAIAPRGDAYLIQDATGNIISTQISNHHPEVSFATLWQKIWYESYEAPAYVWQATGANADFEPKLSLTPLAFGTMKAAFYAMMFAVPLAVLGAIYTAYFMSPRYRVLVKPTIEVMEALPTVVLGFLAGLWLAPFVEKNLAGVLLCIVLLPIFVIALSCIYQYLPSRIRTRFSTGFEAVLLIPCLVGYFLLVLELGHWIEFWFFDADLPHWLSNELNIRYEQRNALVVGLAMGFAVTPAIFSIAEDAVFSVPKHLSSASLALGATPWQTLTRVVIFTASPGIFSAIIIGLGRAVGETMIVLMSTGNTAIIDLSLLNGFRTLSANIGVEMPEAGVGETHYRVLFLSALVLFGFTFFVNTMAELVRQRLRERYSVL